MVAELASDVRHSIGCCSLAKISMVAELASDVRHSIGCCSLAKISMVAEQIVHQHQML